MENRIKDNIDNPELLENLYQTDKSTFKKSFYNIYPEILESSISDFWKARLDFDSSKDTGIKIGKAEVLFLILSCLLAGFLVKLPEIFGIDFKEYLFYEKNVGLIVFIGLSAYSFLSKGYKKPLHLIISLIVFAVSALYINLLPSDKESTSINLAYIHLPLLIWCLYGLILIDFDLKDKSKRIDFIKHNGDLAILGAIVLIAGGALTAITLGLFSAIDINIEDFYIDYIVMIGLVSAPIVVSYIIKTFPSVTNKIAPIIANIFSPLVLITLVIYLISIVITGKDPYNDRDFLLIFNILLIGVMGIIVFSVSETSVHKKQKFNEMILLALVVVTLVIDLIALSAILYRLGEFGFTANRIVVLGSNLLIFGNLLIIMIDLIKVNFKNHDISRVGITIAKYLPIYTIWTILVVFVLPFVFGMK